MDDLQGWMKHLKLGAKKNANWVIVLGVMLILFGMFATVYMTVATLVAIYFFGALMVISGFLQIFGAFQLYKESKKWLWVVCGVLYVIAGYIVFSYPLSSSYFFTLFLAISLLVGGFFRIFDALHIKPLKGWGWSFFSGLLSIITAIIILSTPSSFLWVIGLFLGIDMLFQGWSYVLFGLMLKNMK